MFLKPLPNLPSMTIVGRFSEPVHKPVIFAIQSDDEPAGGAVAFD